MKNKNKQKNQYIIITTIISLLITLIVLLSFFNADKNINKTFTEIDTTGYDNLMIIAHPTDELLWGGAHLIEDNYLVVCITCTNEDSQIEFNKVIKETNDISFILNYPETTNNIRENWSNYEENIIKDLNIIINSKNWNKIITHNPNGEYGHEQHKLINKYVTNITINKDNLYYFGYYYSKLTIGNNYEKLVPINNNLLNKKVKLIGIYKSQSFIQTSFNHMYKYENLINYKEWVKS